MRVAEAKITESETNKRWSLHSLLNRPQHSREAGHRPSAAGGREGTHGQSTAFASTSSTSRMASRPAPGCGCTAGTQRRVRSMSRAGCVDRASPACRVARQCAGC